jgi:hypothetical protein
MLLFFGVDRRNGKPLETHTHKVERPGFEPRSWRPTLAILAFQSVELAFVHRLTAVFLTNQRKPQSAISSLINNMSLILFHIFIGCTIASTVEG